ncbi:hypothetical protein SDC9_166543 [bioreactor metagenome]|uniref:Uncharacterized protein n=1 Tax=bioreactor metagenome TaxID=1076179 RepID=A0A645FXC6_9ZZZZ
MGVVCAVGLFRPFGNYEVGGHVLVGVGRIHSAAGGHHQTIPPTAAVRVVVAETVGVATVRGHVADAHSCTPPLRVVHIFDTPVSIVWNRLVVKTTIK